MRSLMDYTTKENYVKKLSKSLNTKCIIFANTQKQADKLEKIEIEQRSYWAKTVAVFTILLGLFVVIFDRMPALTTSQSIGIPNLLWQNFIVLFIPLTIIIIVFAIVIYVILRK